MLRNDYLYFRANVSKNRFMTKFVSFKCKGLLFLGFMVFTTFLSADIAFGQTERSSIEDKYKWNLSDIYPSEVAWSKDKDQLKADMEGITKFKGTLASSASQLLTCLNYMTEVNRRATRLYGFAHKLSDQDARDMKALGMEQELEQLFSVLSEKASYIDPEVLAAGKAKIDGFVKIEKGFDAYSMYFDNLFRQQAHLLSEGEESILANSGLISSNSSSAYSTFSDAEMPFARASFSDGKEILVDKQAYDLLRSSSNKADRDKVFEVFWGNYKKFEATFGQLLYGQVKRDIFYAKARKYGSSLESALDNNNIPTSVYHSLVDNVNKNLPTFHRYLKLKKQMMGLDTLKYSDIYAPVVKGVELKYSYEEAKPLILDAFRPLGKEYVSVVEQAFNDSWIDVLPNAGKRSGAYSSGDVYDVHPYILLNYNGKYEDVSTLAHELGHTMQSYYSNKVQPIQKADYSIFVAEVASTFNESLLMDKMLREITNKQERLSLLMSYLDKFKGTLFRQTQFAEFELSIHERAEKGEPLTGEVLTSIYLDILKRYYGDAEGVTKIDDVVAMEWAFIPHFYYNFYVFQYSTSFTASMALASAVLENKPGSKERYMAFISGGCSKYPIDILKEAGVDMTTSAPFDATIKEMNAIMDEIKALIKK